MCIAIEIRNSQFERILDFRTSVFYMLVNLAVGISFVCVVFMWMDDLTAAGKTIQVPQMQELFIPTLIYDVMSHCYGKFAQVWAFMAYMLIVLAGFASMVSMDERVFGKFQVGNIERLFCS